MFPRIVVPQNGWFIMENPVKMDDLYYKRCINIMYIRHISYLHITYIFFGFSYDMRTWCMIYTHDISYIHMIYDIYIYICVYIYSVLHTVWYMYIHVYPIDIQTHTLTFFIILKTQKKTTTRQNCSLLIGGMKLLLFYSSLVEHWPTLLENATQYATFSLCK